MISFLYFLLFLNLLDAYNIIYLSNLNNLIVISNISKIFYNNNILSFKNNNSNIYLLDHKKYLFYTLKNDTNFSSFKILNIYSNNFKYINYYNSSSKILGFL